jgi:hypothetical protein
MTLTLHQEPRTGPFPLLHDGLCLFLPFETTDSPATPREQITGARPANGTTSRARDKWGNGIARFNGTTEHLKYNDGPGMRQPSMALTAYCRVYFASLPGSGAPPVGKDVNAGAGYSYGLEAAAATTSALIWTSASNNTVAPACPTSSWVSIFARWISGAPLSVEGYYDGGRIAIAKTTAGSFTGPLAYDAGQLLLGTSTGGTHLAMDLACFAVWNRRITDAEMFLLVSDPEVLFRRTNLSLAPLAAVPADVSYQPIQPLRRAGHL